MFKINILRKLLCLVILITSFVSEAERPYNILLIVQEKGHIVDDTNGLLKHDGNRSVGLVDYYQTKLGNKITQIKVADCEIEKSQLFVQGQKVNLALFDGVVKRTWDGSINSLKGLEIIRLCERNSLLADNLAQAIEITLHKDRMQRALDECKVLTPVSFIYNSKNNIQKLSSDIKFLKQKFKNKKLKSDYPAFVLKKKNGTHGNGVRFFKLEEEKELKDKVRHCILEGEIVILQEYIRPEIYNIDINKEHSASHMRIIISIFNNEYKVIGGLLLEREGSWVSNSHSEEGRSYIQSLKQDMLNKTIIDDLIKVASHIGMNQFGADVIKSATDGKFYILELNDGMGISGVNLEALHVPEKYVESFNRRLQQYSKK
ncbi:MAG: RimK-like ATP-grasp domain [Rickettsiaceae bacterium]|jgi:glutathione synthase/RimK-type ligase-like ATP-grasp enzyme|nr:RimK-like ATP-grasp domain [Rickettsiaceae bacterium]